MNSEVNLWLSVISICFSDAFMDGECVEGTNKYAANMWFEKEGDDFTCVCDLAQVDPQYIIELYNKMISSKFFGETLNVFDGFYYSSKQCRAVRDGTFIIGNRYNAIECAVHFPYPKNFNYHDRRNSTTGVSE